MRASVLGLRVRNKKPPPSGRVIFRDEANARAPAERQLCRGRRFVCVTVTEWRGTFYIAVQTPAEPCRGWPADEVTDDDDTYQSFECVACTRMHLVNLKTGKVLSEE